MSTRKKNIMKQTSTNQNNLQNLKEFFLNHKKIIQNSAAAALLTVAVVLIGYYTLWPSRGFFHSDTTDTIIWAEQSVESKSLFNPDFYYACLLPFGTSLIMTALIPFTGVSMTTHVIGMLCFFVLFTIGLIWMLRQMGTGWGWTSVTVFTVLMICSGSEKLREIFWGHTIYYSLGVWFIFVGLALLFRRMDLAQILDRTEEEAQKRRLYGKLILCTILILVWFILTCSDQIIAITIFALPVIGAVLCERWLDKKTRVFSVRNFHALAVLLVMIIGMIGGYLLTNRLADGITAAYEEAYSEYSDMSEWWNHIELFPTAWLSLLGADMAKDEPLMSVKSVKALFVVITGILLLILPLTALLCYHQIRDEKLRILILTYWFMTILIMMGYIMGKLSAANWRLSPIVAMSAVVSMAFLRWAVSQIQWQRLGALLMIPLVIVSSVTAHSIAHMPKDNTSENTLYALAEELESRGLNYGYATFWQANGLTVVSDSKIKCRSIDIDENDYHIRHYQCNPHWYEDQEGQEQYFLLMTFYERQILESINSRLLSRSHQVLNISGYEVWVFSENIF